MDVAKELHAHDGVDEEEHHHQHHDIGQSLDGLDESEKQNSDANASSEELDETGGAEESQKANIDQLGGVNDAASYSDEIKRVPRVLEIGFVAEARELHHALHGEETGKD